MTCRNEVFIDVSGHWHVKWECGVESYGVSDYDLARARKKDRHKCMQKKG